MKNYDWVFFDLDGTLTDSGPGIMKGVWYALQQNNMTDNFEELRVFIGPPLIDAFMERYGVSRDLATKMLADYRVYYNDKGIFENSVYEGIPELLKRLKEAGKGLIVATSKPEVMALRVLEHFDLTQYFTVIRGATLDGKLNEKKDIIRVALQDAGITDSGDVIMVGDRKFDVIGAADLGMECIGVTYGYGSAEELNSAGAAALADTPAEVGDIVLNQ